MLKKLNPLNVVATLFFVVATSYFALELYATYQKAVALHHLKMMIERQNMMQHFQDQQKEWEEYYRNQEEPRIT
tara:strand:+ start:19453 stop:19674 length:222 start_codon:yes stop_codon:yes gene_type:complete